MSTVAADVFLEGGLMAWVWLVVAGLFEWGWPVGLKFGMADGGLRWGWIAFAIVCMTASGACLLIAQKTIPMGTAYAVWTGIGAVGAFVLGLILFAEPATLARFFFVGLIVAGIIGLKLSSPV
jgi:quaternary ammonium compound-resistance protein SugE